MTVYISSIWAKCRKITVRQGNKKALSFSSIAEASAYVRSRGRLPKVVITK